MGKGRTSGRGLHMLICGLGGKWMAMGESYWQQSDLHTGESEFGDKDGGTIYAWGIG